MVWNLSGRTALVTGASSGLGVHFAKTLAGAGAHVILAARRQEALAVVAEAITASGGSCTMAPLDVADTASIAALAPQLDQVDILVNNAGTVREGAAINQSEDDWDAVVDTNLKGLFFLAQLTVRAMKEHGRGGSIINIASILGVRQAKNVLPYAVSKAGVIQLTKSLALEVARYGIRVNAIAPGYFPTEINSDFWEESAGQAMLRRIPQNRLGRHGDLDGPLLLLASDASAYMTGSVVTVDGGHLLNSL